MLVRYVHSDIHVYVHVHVSNNTTSTMEWQASISVGALAHDYTTHYLYNCISLQMWREDVYTCTDTLSAVCAY